MAFPEYRDLQLREDDVTTANSVDGAGGLAEVYPSTESSLAMDPTATPSSHNVSMSPELLCYMTALTDGSQDDSRYAAISCPVVWDGLTCWPRTSSSSLAVVPCFASLNGLDYDTTQNVTRQCWQNGSWALRSDYSNCRPVLEGATADTQVDETLLYYIGYGLSLCALTLALWIFFYFKDLSCLRNTIHVNLMVTYFLISIIWIITATLQSVPLPNFQSAACGLYIVLTYLMGTNFFWMFVEGLYLYILVVKTFSVEVVRIHVYAFIGWGLPAIITAIWATTKSYLSSRQHSDLSISDSVCVWQMKDLYDCIFIVPVIGVLLTNMFFLGEIMWVLITKLRAANTIESRQYRKAAKALLVLLPLLGVTYILVIWTPTHKTARVIFTYLQITLLSTQGFNVAVLYCFLNGEVRKSVRHHLERWKTARALKRGGRRRSSTSRFGDVRVANSKRGSCGSFATTTTSLGNTRLYSATGKRFSNTSYGPVALKDELV
ncbi:diuretic hormone receptor-like isoform X2 [Dermacentor albipictus]|uniref:diuretic hormone receptor-like isoform X2 n=1 Tax=Dermacentor albipictus TaxID=60249 RepID=UPI0031FC7831